MSGKLDVITRVKVPRRYLATLIDLHADRRPAIGQFAGRSSVRQCVKLMMSAFYLFVITASPVTHVVLMKLDQVFGQAVRTRETAVPLTAGK